jgi:hypothetical protein
VFTYATKIGEDPKNLPVPVLSFKKSVQCHNYQETPSDHTGPDKKPHHE